MKERVPYLRPNLLSIVVLSTSLIGALAQEATFPVSWGCNGSVKTNSLTINNSRLVDLDHDGKTDFRFVSMTAFAWHPTRPPNDPYFCYYTDNTLAYFAERHVQMYLKPVTSTCAMDTPKAVVAQGTLISAQPNPTNSWQWKSPYDIPSLQGIGFGRTARSQSFNDPHTPGGHWEPGYLSASHPPIQTNALFGFRLQSDDGWHTGWMRIRWAPTVYTIDSVKMIEYAVSPTPDTDIIAGVHVGAPLQIATIGTNGTSLRIAWPTTATNLILETKPDLGATNWVTVQGITNNEVILQPTNATSFYRLRGQ